MLSFVDITISLFASFSLLSGSFLTSKIIGKILRVKSEISLFWSLVLGLFFIVSLFAIFKTSLITLLLPAPFLIIFLQKNLATQFESSKIANKQIYLFSISTFIVQFALYFLFIGVSNAENVKYIAGDFSIYYRAAEYLNASGIEANQYSLIPKLNGALTPYHYGDLWFYALVRQFTYSNPSVVFLIAFTVLSFIFTVGLYEFAYQKFAKQIEGREAYLYLLIFAGLFTGFKAFFPFFILPGADPYILAIFNWGKVLVLSTMLIGMVLLMDKGQEKILCAMAVLAGILYINAIPTIFSALFLLLAIRALRNEISWKQFVQYVVSFGVLTGLYMLLVYKGIPTFFDITKTNENKESALEFFKTKKYFKTAFNIFVGGWFQLFTLLPYFILLAIGLWSVYSKSKIKQIFTQRIEVVIFLFLLFFSGLFCWAVMFPISVDTVQFFHNILAPVYAIAISFGFLYLVYVVGNKLLIALMTTCLVASVLICSTGDLFYIAHFDKKEWNALDKFVGNNSKAPFFVTVQSLGKYGYWSSKKTDMYVPLTILSYKWNLYHNVALMAPFVPTDPSHIYIAEEKNDLKTATFSRYYFEKKINNNPDSTIIQNFVSANRTAFITISKDTVLPRYLTQNVIDSLILGQSETIVYKLK